MRPRLALSCVIDDPRGVLTIGLQRRPGAGALLGLLLFCAGCRQESQDVAQHTSEAKAVSAVAPAPSPESATIEASPTPPPPECPTGMVLVPGGQFWVGTEVEVFKQEENPRFQTHVPSFCADVFEVSTNEYDTCQKAGDCSERTLKNVTCNSVEKGKGEHPINCLNFDQAESVCQKRGARLPTEVEWEYMARGGAQMLQYPWGDAHPDGHTCWKHQGTCERGKFSAGAFGLHDVVGNVWEWTSSWFGPYPWPQQAGRHRVYKGGSWSRRFEKWMRPTLRNRLDPQQSGSHLGVRCVLSLKTAKCPYGEGEEGICLAGVDAVSCLGNAQWNGVRCAKPEDKQRCPEGAKEVKGFGCVGAPASGPVSQELDVAAVTRARSPEFDEDCLANSPGRPQAYRFVGGGHLARNAVGDSLGCKNRDVGVGFNSSCCPQ